MSREKIEITENLFSHINNDPFLAGSHGLEGQKFKNTVGYLTQYIESLRAQNIDVPEDVLRLVTACSTMADKVSQISDIDRNGVKTSDLTPIAEDWFKLIQENLTNQEDYLLFPGGWRHEKGGHAIIYQFQKDDNGDLIFTVNNSGAGIQYHAKRSIEDKELYSPVLQYRIPKEKINDQKNFVPILQSLIEGRIRHLHKNYDAHKLYNEVFPQLNFLDASIEPPPADDKNYLYTGGQLSGTCAQRSIHQMLKSKFESLDDYRKFIFEFKAHALKDYMEKLRESGDIANPKYHSQIKKAIRHQMRLLNVDKQGQSGEALFPESYRRQYQQNYEAYLSELSGTISPVVEQSESGFDSQLHDLFVLSADASYRSDYSRTRQSNAPAVSENLPLPQGGAELIHEMDNLLDFVKTSQNKKDSFEALEKFFLSLPLPGYKESSLISFYSIFRDQNPDRLKKFFKLMGDLQKHYFELGVDVVGKDLLLPRMMTLKASNFAVCSHVARNSGGLASDYAKLIQAMPLNITALNQYASYFANHDPEYDKRLQQVQKLYPKEYFYDLHNAFPSSFEGLRLKHYVKIIEGFPDLKADLEKRFEETYGKDSSEELRIIRDKGIQSLYYYLENIYSHKDRRHFSRIQDAFETQMEMEEAFAAGLRQLNGIREYQYLRPAMFYDKNKNFVFMESKLDRFSYFLCNDNLMNSQYHLPDGPVKNCLNSFVNQRTNRHRLRGEILGMPSSNSVQLHQWEKDTSSDNGLFRAEDIEERELFHLRNKPEIQIILTLEYFLKHPEKLSRHDMQVYCDANIFQPGLLLELLENYSQSHQETFWSLLNNFVSKGIEASQKKGELTEQSLFYVRMYQSITQYAYMLDPEYYAKELSTLKKDINRWLAEPQNQEQWANLHFYRFLTLNAQLQANKQPLTDEEMNELLVSYFVLNVNPLPAEYSEPDSAYRFEMQKKSFMRNMLTPPEQLSVEILLPELEKMGLIPPASQRQSEPELEFPKITFLDSSGARHVVDLQQGMVFRNNMARVHTPQLLLNHPVIKHFGMQNVRQCWMTANQKQFVVEMPPTKLRFTNETNGQLVVEQMMENKDWYVLRSTSSHQDDYFNPHRKERTRSSEIKSKLPEKLKERFNFVWQSPDAEKMIITDEKNSLLYTAERGRGYGNVANNQWTIKDHQQSTVLHHHNEIERLLSDIESSEFIFVSQTNDDSLKVRLFRYGLELHKPADQDKLYLTWDGKDYELDAQQQLSPHGLAALHFANQTRCVLPVTQYLSTGEREPGGEYYLFEADKKNSIATDMVEREPKVGDKKFDHPLAWQYSGSRKALVLKMKNGEPYPETPAEALYLCYVYLASHQEIKALQMLEACDKRLGGLEGTYDELQYIRWICDSLPYQPGHDKDEKATISTPSVVACQLKAISLLTEFSKLGKEIQMPALNPDVSTPEAFIENQELQENQFFYDSKVNTKIYQLYSRYQLMRRDLSVDFILSEADSRSLLNYFHESLPAADGSGPKAIGSLGYDWVRLNFINLKRELYHIQHKIDQQIELSDFELKRKDMIESLLQEHEGVYKTHSELEPVEIDLSLPASSSLYNISPAAQTSFLDDYQSSVSTQNLQPLESRYTDAIEQLSSGISADIFANNFAVYLSIAMSDNLEKREVLEKFCLAILRSNCHLPISQHKNEIPVLSNILHRVISEKKRQSAQLNHPQFRSADAFYNWINKLSPTPVTVLQLKDKTSELLVDTEAVQSSIPDQRAAIKPDVDAAMRESLDMLTLYESGQMEAILSNRNDWQRWEHQFYTGRSRALLTASSLEISDKVAGKNKKQALTELQKLAGHIFDSRESIIDFHTQSVKRLNRVEEEKEYHQIQLLSLANQGPSSEENKQRWDIDIAADKRKPLDVNQLLALFFQNDMLRYQEATGLDNEKIIELHGQIGRFLKFELISQQLQRINKEAGKLSQQSFEDINDASFFKLAQQLFAPNLISIFDNPALSVFQSHQNILLRPHQKEALEQLLKQDDKGHYQEVVEKIVMGGGKSKVLLPNIAFHKANGDNLVIIEVPKALLRTNYVDLKSTSNSLFGQSAVIFEFSRESDCSSKALQTLFKRFSDVMVNKNYIVTTGESMQSLELKYLELLANQPEKTKEKEFKEWEQQVFWAEHLILMVKNRGDCLIDEVHQGLMLKNRLNYTVGESKVLSRFVRDNVLALYQFFNEVPLTAIDDLQTQGLTMASLLQAYKPIQTKTQYEQACGALVTALLEKPGSPLLEGLRQAGKSLSEAETGELRQYLLDEIEDIPLFIETLPEDAKELIALYKEEVNHLLPFTLSRNANEHYGPSHSTQKMPGQRAVAIPYRANNTPNEKSSFGNEIETINYTIQSMLINGISQDLLKQYLAFLLQQAKTEAKENNIDSINDTPSGSLFSQITNNMHLTDLDTENSQQMKQLHDQMAHNKTLIFEVLKNNVLKNIRMNTGVLSSNAMGHVDMMNTVQAFSGTPWNASTYHQRLDYKRELAFGTDEYIIGSLKRKNTPVGGADFSNPEGLVSTLLSQYEASDELRNIIDISAAFKGISNERVARQIAEYIENNHEKFNHPKQIKFILFFNDKDELSALPVEKNGQSTNIITFGSSSEEIIYQRLGCSPEERFTYYDQAHTLGTDIAQSEKAKGLVLCDQSTMISNFLQGVLRNREILDGQQSVDIYVPQEMAKGQKVNELCKGMQEQEKAQLRIDNYLSAHYKLNNLVRRDLLNRMINCQEGPERKAELFKIYQQHFIEQQQENLFKRFGSIAKPVDTSLLLKWHQEALLKSWETLLTQSNMDISSEDKETLATQMTGIIDSLIEKGECDAKQLSPGKAEAIEVELLTEVEKMEERLTAQFSPDLNPEPFVRWNGQEGFKNLSEICQSASPSYVPDFDENIRASRNFYQTYVGQTNFLGMYMLPVHALFFEKEGDNIRCTLLSPEEFEEAKNKVQNTSSKQAWISTLNHNVLAGAMPENIKENSQYKKMIEQVRFFNGDLKLLLDREYNLTWLDDNARENLDFFENYLASARESNLTDLEELRMGLAGQTQMLKFIAQHPQRNYRKFDWKKHFPTASDSDVKDMENVALAFELLTGLWWMDGVNATYCARHLHLSTTALGYLAQYEKTVLQTGFLQRIKSLIIAFENATAGSPEYNALMPFLISVLERGDKEISDEDWENLPSSMFDGIDLETQWRQSRFYDAQQESQDLLLPSAATIIPKLFTPDLTLDDEQYNRLLPVCQNNPDLAFSLLKHPFIHSKQENIEYLFKAVEKADFERLSHEIVELCQAGLDCIEVIAKVYPPELQKKLYLQILDTTNSNEYAKKILSLNHDDGLLFFITGLAGFHLFDYDTIQQLLERDELVSSRVLNEISKYNWMTDERFLPSMLNHPARTKWVLENLAQNSLSEQQLLAVLSEGNAALISAEMLWNAINNAFSKNTQIELKIMQQASVADSSSVNIESLAKLYDINIETLQSLPKESVIPVMTLQTLLDIHYADRPMPFDLMKNVFDNIPITGRLAETLLDSERYNLNEMDEETVNVLIRQCQSMPLLEKLLEHPSFSNISEAALLNVCQSLELPLEQRDLMREHEQCNSEVLAVLIPQAESLQELLACKNKESFTVTLAPALAARAGSLGVFDNMFQALLHDETDLTMLLNIVKDNKLNENQIKSVLEKAVSHYEESMDAAMQAFLAKQSPETVSSLISQILDSVDSAEKLQNILLVLKDSKTLTEGQINSIIKKAVEYHNELSGNDALQALLTQQEVTVNQNQLRISNVEQAIFNVIHSVHTTEKLNKLLLVLNRVELPVFHYKLFATHDAADSTTIRLLNQLGETRLAQMPELKMHLDAYMQYDKFMEHLVKLDELAVELDSQYSEAASAAHGLATELHDAAKRLVDNQSRGLIDERKINDFKCDCLKAFDPDSDKMKTLQQSPKAWYRVSPILRGLLGVIAAITIIPAVIVKAASTKGFRHTFFSAPEPTKADTQIKDIEDLIDKFDDVKPQERGPGRLP